jgi:hypothetical protein
VVELLALVALQFVCGAMAHDAPASAAQCSAGGTYVDYQRPPAAQAKLACSAETLQGVRQTRFETRAM